MTEQLLVSVLPVLGTLGVAALAWLAAAQARTWSRVKDAENRVQSAEVTNQALWVYTRVLIDAHYRGGLGPPPPPPDHIKHLYEIGDPT